MARKVKIFSILFVLTATGIILNALYDGHKLVTGVLILLILCLFAWLMKLFLAFNYGLLIQSGKILNSTEPSKSIWRFSNLEQLEMNHKQIDERFSISVNLIESLSKTEEMQVTQSLPENDPIGNALQKIRSEMLELKKVEDQRAWINHGLALFGEILRKKSEFKEYGHQIISQLVKYTGANQGGLYVEYLDEEKERYLELVACYAYDKRKYVEQKISEGQGLLGQCMLERDFIFITDIPKNYVKITSGLGEATPRNIIVAPLMFNDAFHGVIELALFEVLKPHQVEFLKRVCENIASEIASQKTMQSTQQLLDQSNILTRELQSSEEEMRQNLEELAATQEEMARKQSELSGMINAIDSTLATAEFDILGGLVKSNVILQNLFEFDEQQIKTKKFDSLIGNSTEKDIWRGVLSGVIKSGEYKTKTRYGKDLWLNVTFTLIEDTTRVVKSVLCMIQDVSERKTKEIEFERLSLVANNTDNSVIVTNANGITEYVNQGFTRMTGYQSNEIIGKKPGHLLQGPYTNRETVERIRVKLKEGVSIYEEILNYNKSGETYWVSLAINPVRDVEGNISKFISIQSDITQTKIEALDFHQKMDALGKANAILELDKNGVILDVNNNYLNILGYTREEVVGKSYALLNGKPHVFDKVLKVISEDGIQSGVYTRYSKSREVLLMKLINYPVMNIKGELVKIIEFGTNVTKEKKLELEAERKQAELDSYLAGINNTIASVEFDINGKCTDANDIFQKVLGFSKNELTNQSFHSIMGEEPATILMWENLKVGKFFSGEFKMKDKTGKEVWLNGTFNPITILDAMPEKIIMLAQFTTQEKEKLGELTSMVQALKATLPVLELNEKFQCKTANERFLKLFGLSRMDLRSKALSDFLAPYFAAELEKKMIEIQSSDFSSLVIPMYINNTIVNFEVSISMSKNLEGKISKIILLLVKEVDQQVFLSISRV